MNVKRGKKRLLIAVPVLSAFLAFFGGVRFWAMYEITGVIWGIGVVFAFIILLVWFFVRTMRWIVKGFDLWDDKWMSLKEVENNGDKLRIALREDDVVIRREKLRALAEGHDPDNNQAPRQDTWWHRNFPDSTFAHTDFAWVKWWPEYRLYGFVLILVLFVAITIVGLTLQLLGAPPSS